MVTAQQAVSLFVHPVGLTILNATLPVPAPPLPYAATPKVEGGTPPYTFSIISGALPAGLKLNSTSGTLYTVGTLAAGPYSFTLQVADSAAANATQVYSGTVPATSVSQNFTSYCLPNAVQANGTCLPNVSGGNGITVGRMATCGSPHSTRGSAI